MSQHALNVQLLPIFGRLVAIVMTFHLGNPPIIEAWIQASLQPAPESEWSWGAADTVLRSFGGELDQFEHLPAYTPEAKKLDKDNLPTEFEIRVEPRYLRVRNRQSSRAIQIGRNELLVSALRQDAERYPGFRKLRQSFLEALELYCKHVAVNSIHSIEVHYADLVAVPNLLAENRELDEIFVGAPRLPAEPFGVTCGAAWSTSFVNEAVGIPVQLAIEMLPPDGDDGRFRMDWHATVPHVASLEPTAVADGLNSAHSFVLKCFRAIFKSNIWQLFEPLP